MALDSIVAVLKESNPYRIEHIASDMARNMARDKDLIVFSRTNEGVLVFSYGGPFDATTDEYDFLYGEFPKDAYDAGKKQLQETGKCTIVGNGCSVEIKKLPHFYDIYFHSEIHKSGISFARATLDGFL
jgi:hypothetical protein